MLYCLLTPQYTSIAINLWSFACRWVSLCASRTTREEDYGIFLFLGLLLRYALVFSLICIKSRKICCHIVGGSKEQKVAGVKPFCALLFTIQESWKQLQGSVNINVTVISDTLDLSKHEFIACLNFIIPFVWLSSRCVKTECCLIPFEFRWYYL